MTNETIATLLLAAVAVLLGLAALSGAWSDVRRRRASARTSDGTGSAGSTGSTASAVAAPPETPTPDSPGSAVDPLVAALQGPARYAPPAQHRIEPPGRTAGDGAPRWVRRLGPHAGRDPDAPFDPRAQARATVRRR